MSDLSTLNLPAITTGTELLTNPSIIMLDEPTSGLDSAGAVSLINMLQDLALRENKTILTSIHQPSSATFQSFDKLLMLVHGCVAYFGAPTQSLSFLNKNGFQCPDGYNASDYWMELLVSNFVEEEVDDEDVESQDISDEKQEKDLESQDIFRDEQQGGENSSSFKSSIESENGLKSSSISVTDIHKGCTKLLCSSLGQYSIGNVLAIRKAICDLEDRDLAVVNTPRFKLTSAWKAYEELTVSLIR